MVCQQKGKNSSRVRSLCKVLRSDKNVYGVGDKGLGVGDEWGKTARWWWKQLLRAGVVLGFVDHVKDYVSIRNARESLEAF